MSKKYNMELYKQSATWILDQYVFRKIRFLDKDMRSIVYDSYILNLDPLIQYATAKHINVEQYFKELKDILLESEHVYAKQR